MSLSTFINRVNNKRILNKLKTLERYTDRYCDSNIVIKIYDAGLLFYDITRNILVLDLNVIE